MDTTTTALILGALTALFLWGFWLGFCFGRTSERATVGVTPMVETPKPYDADARLREHAQWIEENLDAIANRPDVHTNKGA